MIITSDDGRCSLELSPVAYEFAGAEEVHDRNWLKVRVKASTPSERWGGTDPCLRSKRELDLTVRRRTLASASDALAREVASFPQR